ncbi:MAG: metallophosphoesterase family protein [Promethearchaeota archaeon]|jgi:putative phosphoesterase
MLVRIAILGDTHIRLFEDLPKEMVEEIEISDWVIHTGDFVSLDIINGLIRLKGEKFRGVFGNADPKNVRDLVRSKETLEILGKKIGITHPSGGGPSGITEAIVHSEFSNENLDILIYGHTHEPKIQYKERLLLINPGKGYLETSYFGPSTTIVILVINDGIHAEIKNIGT